jgi:hypothetical protein
VWTGKQVGRIGGVCVARLAECEQPGGAAKGGEIVEIVEAPVRFIANKIIAVGNKNGICLASRHFFARM